MSTMGLKERVRFWRVGFESGEEIVERLLEEMERVLREEKGAMSAAICSSNQQKDQ